MRDVKDILTSFYSNKQVKRPVLQRISELQEAKELSVTTLNIGLGDAIVLTSLTNDSNKSLDIYSQNKHWETLCRFNKKLLAEAEIKLRVRIEILEFFDCGNGHLYQKYQRALGLNVELLPKGYLTPTIATNVKKGKIAINFSTGPSGLDLTSVGFKNPRRLEEKSKLEIEKFIKNTKYDFVEIGTSRMFAFDNVKDFTNRSVEDSLNELSSCEFFIGLNSGFMNASSCFGIKSIIIVNVPRIQDLYLPMIVDFYDDATGQAQDIEWLFPQNVHLHQNGQNELVPIVSEDSLKMAINGDVYPYWKFDFLDLIFKK
jgi:hypothetical protein